MRDTVFSRRYALKRFLTSAALLPLYLDYDPVFLSLCAESMDQ